MINPVSLPSLYCPRISYSRYEQSS